MLLNHDVAIDPAATAIHGYTREHLREHGHPPGRVYELFREYAQDYPLVAHNLSFDWNRCLEPEWKRLGVPQIGQRGFCCMLLARRLVTETKSYRLDALKNCFQLTPSRSHQAENDVLTVVELFQKVYRQRLESAQLDTFDVVTAFTKQTPVAKCQAIITRAATVTQPKPVALKDEWYFLDAATNSHGPLPAREVVSHSERLDAYYVWREGMADWVVNRNCLEFLTLCQSPPVIDNPAKKIESTKTMSELIGLCRGIIADNKVTTAEVMFLNSWLQDVGFISEWPASEIAQTMERILEDGIITKEEKEELKKLLQRITGDSAPPAEVVCQVLEALDFPQPAPTKSVFCSIVQLDQGTPEWLEWRHKGIGASDAPIIMEENPWKNIPDLLRHKRGAPRDQGGNAAMARGTMLEPEARKQYILRRGMDIQPACLQSTQYEWMRASVDGISFDGNIVVEIKCGDSVYRKTSLSGRPPDYYYGQLQHILAVTGFASIDFWCYLPKCRELLVTVNRDDNYIRRLLEAEYKFWQKVITL
jgi:putative phage-type endonuclease